MTENSRKNHTLHLENGNWAEDMGSVFLATVAASAQTFFLLLSFSFFLFPCEAALTHDINLYCYTHQCWFIAALVWCKRQDERFCRDGRRLGKRQRWGKASLIVFVVFFYFLHFFSFFFFSYTSASTVWLSRLFLGLTPRLDFFFFLVVFLCNDDTLQSPKTLNLSPSTLPPPPLPPSSFSSLHKRQNIREMKQESGEAFWDAQRVVDVEHFRHCCCCCRLLPPLCFPLCLSLSACLSARLSVSVLVVRRTWQLASLGCLPPLRVQYVQSTLCQLFIFSSRLVLSQSVPRCCFLFFFFLFSNLGLTFTVWQPLLSQGLQMEAWTGWGTLTQPLLGAFKEP